MVSIMVTHAALAFSGRLPAVMHSSRADAAPAIAMNLDTAEMAAVLTQDPAVVRTALAQLRAHNAEMRAENAELVEALEDSIRTSERQNAEIDELYEDLQSSEAALAAASDQIAVLEASRRLNILGAAREKADAGTNLEAMRSLLEVTASALTAAEAEKRRISLQTRFGLLAALLINEVLARFTSLGRAVSLLTAICATASIGTIRHPSLGRLKGSMQRLFSRGLAARPVDAARLAVVDEKLAQLSALEVQTGMVGRVVPTSMATIIPGVATTPS